MKIAVVIPALDESSEIRGAIESAMAPDVEIVVVDGGSRDETSARAAEAGARVVGGSRGRAAQLQAGVDATQSDVVLFLHADTRLCPGWSDALVEALGDPAVAGGAFRLRFAEPDRVLRVLEWGVRLRIALFGLPYGDQALFVRRAVLSQIGGVPQVDLMEDLDLVQAIKRQGRLRVLALPAITSGRRHLAGGPLRTAFRHLIAALLWRAGVDRDRIRGWLSR